MSYGRFRLDKAPGIQKENVPLAPGDVPPVPDGRYRKRARDDALQRDDASKSTYRPWQNTIKVAKTKPGAIDASQHSLQTTAKNPSPQPAPPNASPTPSSVSPPLPWTRPANETEFAHDVFHSAHDIEEDRQHSSARPRYVEVAVQTSQPPVNLASPSSTPANSYGATAPRTITACCACGGIDLREMNGNERYILLNDLGGARAVMHVLKDRKLTLGDFLLRILSADRVVAGASIAAAVDSFLGGRTSSSAVDVVKALYDHPSARPKMEYEPSYPLPSYAIPPPNKLAGLNLAIPDDEGETLVGPTIRVAARPALAKLFVDEVAQMVEDEVDDVVGSKEIRGPDGAETNSWEYVNAFSLGAVMVVVLLRARVLWTILMAACTGKQKGKRVKEVYEKKDEKTQGRGSNNARDPWQAVLIMVLMLCNFRNVQANVFQAIMGITLFGTNTHRSVIAILNRLGLCVAYSTTTKRLRLLGESAQKELQVIGRLIAAGKLIVHFLYDNINQYRRPWRPTIATKSLVENGTAGTAIIQKVSDPDAFNGPRYHAAKEQNKDRRPDFDELTDDLDSSLPHLTNTSIAHIMRIIATESPQLQHLLPDIERLFSETYAKHRQKLQKTEYYPLACTSFDEATTSGNQDLLADILINQLGLTPEEIDKKLFSVSGDGLTVQRLVSLINQTEKGRSWYSANKHLMPWIEMWHLEYTFLKGIMSTAWAPTSSRGDFGLRQEAETLGRRIDSKKADFYQCRRLLETVFTTTVLNYARCMLRQHITSPPTRPLQLLDELELHSKPGGYLHNCTLARLQSLATAIYETYATSAAAEVASTADEETATKYFHHLSSVTSEVDFGVPPEVEGRNTGGGRASSTGEDDDADEGCGFGEVGGELDDYEPPIFDFEAGMSDRTDADASAPSTSDPSPLLRSPSFSPAADQAFANNARLFRDMLMYFELSSSVHEGDIGRAFEVIKWLVFYFSGVGSSNYANELRRQAAELMYNCSPELRKAIFDNYLANPSGLPRRFYGRDLLQEHHNKIIKNVLNGRLQGFGTDFLQIAVSLNIKHLSELTGRLSTELGLTRHRAQQSPDNLRGDINHLGRALLMHRHHAYVPSRTQTFVMKDGFSLGVEKIALEDE